MRISSTLEEWMKGKSEETGEERMGGERKGELEGWEGGKVRGREGGREER